MYGSGGMKPNTSTVDEAHEMGGCQGNSRLWVRGVSSSTSATGGRVRVQTQLPFARKKKRFELHNPGSEWA